MSKKDDLINPLMIPVLATAISFCIAWMVTGAFLVLTAVAYGLGGDRLAEVVTFAFLPRGPFTVFGGCFVVLTCAGAYFWIDAFLHPKERDHD